MTWWDERFLLLYFDMYLVVYFDLVGFRVEWDPIVDGKNFFIYTFFLSLPPAAYIYCLYWPSTCLYILSIMAYYLFLYTIYTGQQPVCIYCLCWTTSSLHILSILYHLLSLYAIHNIPPPVYIVHNKRLPVHIYSLCCTVTRAGNRLWQCLHFQGVPKADFLVPFCLHLW